MSADSRPDALRGSPNALPMVPAALKDLLSSNDSPSDTDILILRELHALFSTHLTRLDDEIAPLLSSEKTVTLEQLKEDRAALQDRSRQLLGALSAIRRFPKEVLQEIFFKLIPDEDDSFGFEVLDPLQGAWAVSRVCSSWRSASRHPHLWTTLRITPDGCGCIADDDLPTFITYKNPGALLQTALRYSGSCELDFHVEFRYKDCERSLTRMLDLLDVLMMHSERWADVSLVIPSEVGIHLAAVRGKVPQLNHLSFVGCEPESFWAALEEDEIPVIHAFEVAPLLTQVSLEDVFLRLNFPLLTSFTSTFNAHFPHPVPPLFVIGHCPDLVHMDYFIEPMDDDNIEPRTVIPRISNTSLTRLMINDPALLASLSLPALLSLDVGDMGGMSCLPFIPSFLDASQCSLTELYFRNSTLSEAPLAEILAGIPSLVDLGIEFHIDSEVMARKAPHVDAVLWQLMKSLSEVNGSERHRLVPKLEIIHFELTSQLVRVNWTFVGPELVDMLRSRERLLRKVWLWCNGHPASAVVFPNLGDAGIVALREIKDRGLDIVCFSAGGPSLL